MTRREVKRYVTTQHIVVVGLLETRIKERNKSRILQTFGPSWSWVDNYIANVRGRIWLGWNSSEVSVQVSSVAEQFIHCQLVAGLFQCALTVVYGLHTVDDRKGLWTGLAGLVNSVGSQAWILSGDFHAVLNSNDRLNGADVSRYESQDFADFLFSNDIYELPSAGHFYSWSNKGEGSSRIASRIDRCLGNGIWMQDYGHIVTLYDNAGVSDHCPLVLDCQPEQGSGKRPFSFFNFLADHSQFDAAVTSSWQQPIAAGGLKGVWEKLKRLKMVLKTLHKEEFANVEQRMTLAREELSSIQNALAPNLLDLHLHSQEKICSLNLQKWLRVEEAAWRQKYRIQWLKLGDQNTKFFFSAVKQRRAMNKITMLYDHHDNLITDPDLIVLEIVRFYKDLLGSALKTLDLTKTLRNLIESRL